MGILASGTLPSGVQVSNVYMSFCNETIYVKSNSDFNIFEYTTCYKVFADPTKAGGPAARIPLQFIVPNTAYDQSAFKIAYAHLKTLYPDSVDYFPNDRVAQ
jgi:hypothetical protein